jgi:hypothetical protein
MATILSPRSNNWVDRGHPAERTLARLLAHLFDRHAESDAPWLAEHARAVHGMVAAHATEADVASYLRVVARRDGLPADAAPCARMTAAALWHAAKAALVRDLAEQVLRGEIPPNDPTPGPLGRWLAERLLTRDELATYDAERQRPEAP